MKQVTAIIKPTHRCNISCRYCYIDSRAGNGRMDDTTLGNSIRKVTEANNGRSARFVWHGGEPLLMGLEFYEKVVEIQNEMQEDNHPTNNMQTNLTLLDEELLNFLGDNDFSIGTSLDGPEELHNRTRIYHNGRGSFKDVMRAIELVRRKGMSIGALSTLTRSSLGKARQIYDFFKSLEMDFDINPLVKGGRATRNYEQLSISPEEYGEFMIQLFNLYFYSRERKISVDCADSYIGNLLTNRPLDCNHCESCQDSLISIGPSGDVYPCGRFDGDEQFRLGNINTDNLNAMLTSELRRALLSRRADSIEECRECEYKGICNAGCMHNAHAFNGDVMSKDFYCEAYKIIYRHFSDAIQKELEKASRIEHDTDTQPKHTNKILVMGKYVINPDDIELPVLRDVVKFRFSWGNEGYREHTDYTEHEERWKDRYTECKCDCAPAWPHHF